MPANKTIWTFILLMLVTACIDPFEPVIHETSENMVIEGLLTNLEGYHKVHISRSGPYNSPKFTPESGAFVEIVHQDGHRIILPESEPGFYENFIPASFLELNKTYHVHIVTAGGREYQSRADSLLACPPIDTVYYQEELKETADPHYPVHGVQIYTNLKVPEGYPGNCRWTMEETWEYHSPYNIRYYYAGRIFDLGKESDSLKHCWKSHRVGNIYTQSTAGISGKEIRNIPLNYISNESDRLSVKYSLLVTQYSISSSAYEYWSQLQKQSQETGGLYEQQPVRITGNVYNPKNPEERVLGNFNVSSISTKRIYIEEYFDFPIWSYYCELIVPDPLSWYISDDYPVYLHSLLEGGPFMTANDACFDCREGGGSITPPDWWEF